MTLSIFLTHFDRPNPNLSIPCYLLRMIVIDEVLVTVLATTDVLMAPSALIVDKAGKMLRSTSTTNLPFHLSKEINNFL